FSKPSRVSTPPANGSNPANQKPRPRSEAGRPDEHARKPRRIPGTAAFSRSFGNSGHRSPAHSRRRLPHEGAAPQGAEPAGPAARRQGLGNGLRQTVDPD